MNGYRVGDEFFEGRKVTYKCKIGYWLNGSAESVCNGTGFGNWSKEKPFCESKSFEKEYNTDIKLVARCQGS